MTGLKSRNERSARVGQERAAETAAADLEQHGQAVAFGASGNGFPPQVPARAVMTVDDAGARLPGSMAVLVQCIAKHDRLDGDTDLLMYLLGEHAERIGIHDLFRACVEIADERG